MFYLILLVLVVVLGYFLYTRNQSKHEAGVAVDQTDAVPYKVEAPVFEEPKVEAPAVTVEEIAQKAEVVPPAPVKQPKTSNAKPTAKSKTTAKTSAASGTKTTAKKPASRKTAK